MSRQLGFRKTFETYLIGSVILFTLSVGGTFLISVFKQPVDLLVPLKALTLYGLLAVLLFDYMIYDYFGKIQRELILTGLVIIEALALRNYIPILGRFFGETQHYYALSQYPLTFKLLPLASLIFVISGVFVVVYYSVDLNVPGTITDR